ncbi:MAG: hypothetical protein IPP82_01655 [Xanthomonadales bacterium]|nr:hypothetical protein [Xanthomonadales bacterium]
MRLRSFLLLATALAGTGIGALEFAARSAAHDMAEALEPLATLNYESAGIAFDGSVRLREPRLTVKRGVWKGSVLARVADLRGGGPFWLVGHALGSGPRLPASMRIRARGLHLGDTPAGVPLSGWLGTTDLALFENLGCGSDALSDKDRVRMGVETRERHDEFDYQFDSSAHSLGLSMDLHSDDIAAIHASAQLTGFAGDRWLEPAALEKMRLARVSLGYQDSGYFARRNQFCAQWLGVSAAQFIEKHLEAVEAFLGVRGISAGKELLSLYQRLATRGGSLNLTSLPDSSWVPAEFDAYPKEDLLRLLNITARHEDAPPIMLRLSFSTPESPMNIISVVDPPVAVPAPPADAVSSTLPVSGLSEQGSKATAIEAVPAPALPPVSSSKSAVGTPVPPVAAAPVTVEPPVTIANPEPGTERPPRRIVASAPPPPKDSTLALVWKPGVIERLPAQSAPDKEFTIVAKERLSGLVGSDVQLLTENGKRVEGQLVRIAGDIAVLSLPLARGNAELSVPLAGIREVRLRARSAVSP